MIGYVSGFITGYLVEVIMCMIAGTLLFLALKRRDLVRRARDKIGAWFSVLRGPLSDNRGSVELPQIGEIKKYLLRFGLPLAGLIGLIWLLKPENVGTVLYKIMLILIGLILCELVWLINYKPVFGKIEVLSENERRSVLIFRGVLYLAIVLGITWGL